MRERVIALMEALGVKAIRFSEMINVSPPILSHIIAGRNNPSLEFAVKILSTLPQVDPDWLLLGNGEMFRNNNNNISTAINNPRKSGLFDIQDEEKSADKLIDAGSVAPNIVDVDNNPQPISINTLSSCIQQPDIEQVMILYADKTFVTYKPQ